MADRVSVARAFLLVLFVLGAQSACGQVDFVVETVDSVGVVGQFASIGLDDTGNVRIAYAADSSMRVATLERGNWTVEPILPAACFADNMVIDSSGDMAFLCFSTFAHKVGEAWELETIGIDRDGLHVWFDYGGALTRGADGRIVAAIVQSYVIHHGYPGEGTYHTIMVANRDANVWTWQDLGGPAFVPKQPLKIDAVLDSNGRTHIGVVPADNETFRYYTPSGASWVWESVPDVTADFVIAANALNKPIVVYADDTALWMVRKGSTWIRSKIVDGTTSNPDVAVDGNGELHVKYHTPTEVRYATVGPDGAWQTQLVEPVNGSSGGIVVDNTGAVHLIYQDVDRQDLHYATRSGTTTTQATTWSSIKTEFRR